MKLKLLLLTALLNCLIVSSQVVVGLSPTGFDSLNLTNNTYSLVNNINYGNGYGQGLVTFDQINQRYIYTVTGIGNPDTLVILNAANGLILSKNTYPSNRLFNPQYSAIDNKVFGISQLGFASYDLSTNTFSIINNINYGNGFGQGLNTFDQANNKYIYTVTGNGGPDTLIILNTSNGNFINKFPYPNNGLFNPEYSQISNSVFGISQLGFANFNITTSTYSLINNTNYGNGIQQGQSTFNQTNNQYIYKIAGNGVSDTLSILNVVTGSFISKIPFPIGHLFNCEFSTRNPTDLNEIHNEFESLTIYPNPTKSKISINSNEVIFSFEIIDQLGRIIDKNGQVKNNEISLDNLESGCYIISIRLKGQVKNFKIIRD